MLMQILEITSNSTADTRAAVISQAVTVLKAGGLIIFPTETTYGAGVDATNPDAVAKLLAYKARREGKPLSIAVTTIDMAEKYVELNDSARKVYQRFLPGPVTVVSKGLGVVAPGVESEFGTLGVRIPDYELVLEIVAALGRPMTATSANASGEKRPYTTEDIFSGLSERQKGLIDLVLDTGELPHRPPSTVIDTTLSTPVTFRQGEIEVTSVEPQYTLSSTSESETKAIAGRLLLKHWSEIKDRGLVIGLNGSLGTGKTIFAKGAAEFLQIKESISSPTYTYIEEYTYDRHGAKGMFYHLDVWKVGSQSEFERLDIKRLLMSGSVVIIEWYSQVQKWIRPLIETSGVAFMAITFKESLEEKMATKRQIEIHE